MVTGRSGRRIRDAWSTPRPTRRAGPIECSRWTSSRETSARSRADAARAAPALEENAMNVMRWGARSALITLALGLLAAWPAGAGAQQILLDKPVRAGSLVVFPDLNDA